MSRDDAFSRFYDAVYSQDRKPDGAHGWIQWKGTDACMDLHCACGAHGHVDGDFFYYYRCAACGRVYAVGQVVKLIELTPEQARYAADRHHPYEDDSLSAQGSTS